eukprot:m.8058 g.8058  ORF g.8058 m.8058 type:complete len:73 (+) comp3828_c0_seq2:138-356(+)
MERKEISVPQKHAGKDTYSQRKLSTHFDESDYNGDIDDGALQGKTRDLIIDWSRCDQCHSWKVQQQRCKHCD